MTESPQVKVTCKVPGCGYGNSATRVDDKHAAAVPCPAGLTDADRLRMTGEALCKLKAPCINLGLHKYGADCPFMARARAQDKLAE